MTSSTPGPGTDAGSPSPQDTGARLRKPGRLGTEKPPKHGGGSWRSLVISMLVILAGVLLWQALTPNVSKVERPAVDVAASAKAVHGDTGWPILVADLGPEWKPTSVRFDDRAGARTWEVGYTRNDDDTVFVSVAQSGAFGSGAPSQEWVREFTRSGGADGQFTVGAHEWSAFTATEKKNPRYSLVSPAGATPLPVVVSGLGDRAHLASVAASLKPYTPPAG